jgi:hypothetical protein
LPLSLVCHCEVVDPSWKGEYKHKDLRHCAWGSLSVLSLCLPRGSHSSCVTENSRLPFKRSGWKRCDLNHMSRDRGCRTGEYCQSSGLTMLEASPDSVYLSKGSRRHSLRRREGPRRAVSGRKVTVCPNLVTCMADLVGIECRNRCLRVDAYSGLAHNRYTSQHRLCMSSGAETRGRVGRSAWTSSFSGCSPVR